MPDAVVIQPDNQTILVLEYASDTAPGVLQTLAARKAHKYTVVNHVMSQNTAAGWQVLILLLQVGV